MRFDSDLLDEFCEERFGHADWEYIDTPKGKTGVAVLFNETPSKEYLDEHEEEDELTQQLFGGLADINTSDPWEELAKDSRPWGEDKEQGNRDYDEWDYFEDPDSGIGIVVNHFRDGGDPLLNVYVVPKNKVANNNWHSDMEDITYTVPREEN